MDARSHSHGHAYLIGYGHARRHAHSHGRHTTLPSKPATAGGAGTGNMAIISGFAPGGSTSVSISRVDSPHSGRSSGSGGSAGSMEEVKEGQDQDAGGGKSGESMSNPIPIVGGKMKKRGVEYECESCNKKGWFKITISFFFCFYFLLCFSFQKTN